MRFQDPSNYFVLLEIAFLIAGGSSQSKDRLEISCRNGGICIPSYLCLNNTVITDGHGLIDLRFAEKDCPDELICCQDGMTDASAITPCQGKCVSLFQCLDDVFETTDIDKNLMNNGKTNCPEDQICCYNIRESQSVNSCDGRCVPFNQCLLGKVNTHGKDIINLRSTYDACDGGDLVCCKEQYINNSSLALPMVCGGECVPAPQCLNGTLDSEGVGLIDLRIFDDACPEELVCCDTKSTENGELPNLCNGECVPSKQCLNGTVNSAGEGLINLRISENTCPGGLNCCSLGSQSPDKPNLCNGECVPVDQCSYGTINTTGEGLINLRIKQGLCPGELICCLSSSDQSIELPKVCGGECVPSYQCLNTSSTNTAEGVIDLRIFDDVCPGEMVCCSSTNKPIKSSSCQCVPINKCFDKSVQNVDDQTHQNCPRDHVCCRNSMTNFFEMTNSNECRGKCVPLDQCLKETSNKNDKDILDLRFSSCPLGLVCCDYPIGQAATCDGACVPLSQCDDPPQRITPQLPRDSLDTNNNGCQNDDVCCDNIRRMTADAMKWTQWINDINNMVVSDNQNIKKFGKCSLDIARIVDNSQQNEITWLVTVWRKYHHFESTQDEFLCVGTIVRKDAVLVPADCLPRNTNNHLFVRSGNGNLKSSFGYQELPIFRQIVHPEYDDAYSSNNAALLFLAEPNHHIPHEACLFGYNDEFREHDCMITGWDSLDFMHRQTSNSNPKYLHSPIVRTTTCRPGFFCTGSSQSIDNCDRFHGSPVMCPDQSGFNWRMAAMVVKHNARCDHNGIPDSLLNITRLAPWIREQMSPSFIQKPYSRGPSPKYLPVGRV